MPEASLWTLIVSLGLLAFTFAIKINDLLRDLKHAQDDLARERVKAADKDKEKDQAVADAKNEPAQEIERLKGELEKCQQAAAARRVPKEDHLEDSHIKVLNFIAAANLNDDTVELAHVAKHLNTNMIRAETIIRFLREGRYAYTSSYAGLKLAERGQDYLVKHGLV